MDATVFEAGLAGGLAGLIMAGILVGLSNPWQWVLASEEGYDATDPQDMGDTPMDDPQRSPDWCWAHGEIEEEE